LAIGYIPTAYHVIAPSVEVLLALGAAALRVFSQATSSHFARLVIADE